MDNCGIISMIITVLLRGYNRSNEIGPYNYDNFGTEPNKRMCWPPSRLRQPWIRHHKNPQNVNDLAL